MPTGLQVVMVASTQAGDPYIFGAEASTANPNPRAFDCSELVEWTCGRLGVKPTMVDGARNQKAHCQKYGKLISIRQGIDTPGALLFRISRTFTGDHVAISRGNGQTIEARGRAYGTGIFSATIGRAWTHAALIPGVAYGAGNIPTPPPPPAPPQGPVDWQAVRRMAAASLIGYVQAFPTLSGGNNNLHVVLLQRALNLISGAGVKEDGVFAESTAKAVVNLQKFFGLTADGIVGDKTKFVILASLMNIRDGKA